MTDENATEKRSRKQTTFFQAAAPASNAKATVVEDGLGIKLAENPHFCHDLERVKADSEECKALHSLFYNTVGKKTEIKRNLRAFSGFPSTDVRDEKKLKLLDKKKVWTTSLLKSALGMLGLEKGGDREVLVNRLVDYLGAPKFTKKASDKSKKRKAKSSTRGSKKAKGSGTKRAPSAYLLFCNERRSEVREANPEMSMIEITKALAAQWNDLPASEKEVSLLIKRTFFGPLLSISLRY
jgi:protein DEK